MTGVKDSFLDLERHVRQLEANVSKLKKALDHWRQWDAEYEALKEEVQTSTGVGVGAESETSAAELRRIRAEFDGDLVTGKEVDEIFGQERAPRTAEQVVNLLDRRIEYVDKNVRTLEKQLDEAERKLGAASVISDPGATDETGLPITEIFERLDEDGNVVSHELWTPGSKMPQLQEILQKAGVENAASQSKPDGDEVAPADPPSDARPRTSGPRAPTGPEVAAPATADIPVRMKEVVSDVDLGTAEEEGVEEGAQPEMSRAAQRVQKIMDKAREQEKITQEAPTLPDDESPEDAALRRQMLEYTMNNSATPSAAGMGEVVAIMSDLRYEESDDDSFNSYEDDDDDEDEDEDEDDDGEDGEDEDKYGRTTHRVIDPKYQERMLDLERRLGVQSRFTRQLATSEPGANDGDGEGDASPEQGNLEEGIGKIVVRQPEAEAKTQPPNKSPSRTDRSAADVPASGSILKASGASGAKKSVKFAEALDIAPADTTPGQGAARDADPRPETVANPVSEFIVEQADPLPPKQPEAAAARPRKKASRFQQMKASSGVSAAAADFKEEGAEEKEKPQESDTIMQPLAWSDTPASSSRRRGKSAKVRGDPDDFDEEIDRREIADEYQRRRRKMIAQQGGFLKEEENAIEPIDDEGEPPRRVSRFKAARLARD